jgi:bud emergence protein 1
MKSLRRSLNSDKSNKDQGHSVTGPLPTPLSAPIMGGYGDPTLSRPSAKVAPPQKVIKATHSYQSTVPQILSYQKGDFYYVTDEYPGDSVQPDGWYGALSEWNCDAGLCSLCHVHDPSVIVWFVITRTGLIPLPRPAFQIL